MIRITSIAIWGVCKHGPWERQSFPHEPRQCNGWGVPPPPATRDDHLAASPPRLQRTLLLVLEK